MKVALIVLLMTALAGASTIPVQTAPLQLQYSGVGCNGQFPSANFMCYSLNPRTELESFILENLPDPNQSLVIPGKYARLDATVGSFSFSPTGQVSGDWVGIMRLVARHGDAIYEYAVSGTYLLSDPAPGQGFNGQVKVVVVDSLFMGRVATTPEPGTMWLLGTGLLAIVARRYR